MNVQTITMVPDAAAAKLAACKRELLKRHSQEVREQYSQLEQGYKALAKGTPLINPLEAIRAAGWKDDGTGPKLAIMRADQERCRLRADWNGSEWKWDFVIPGLGRKPYKLAEFSISTAELKPKNGSTAQWFSATATTPLIPPDVMPARGLDRSKHVILWEVESWDAAPPIDPMLLKPIGGGLYAVVAQWDLTPLEQEILREANRI